VDSEVVEETALDLQLTLKLNKDVDISLSILAFEVHVFTDFKQNMSRTNLECSMLNSGSLVGFVRSANISGTKTVYVCSSTKLHHHQIA